METVLESTSDRQSIRSSLLFFTPSRLHFGVKFSSLIANFLLVLGRESFVPSVAVSRHIKTSTTTTWGTRKCFLQDEQLEIRNGRSRGMKREPIRTNEWTWTLLRYELRSYWWFIEDNVREWSKSTNRNSEASMQPLWSCADKQAKRLQ